ncbi:hypothetical protein J2I47_03935 [Fibrella sp. HMF5335]|uniref:Outer membrane protein beta-barrel domain-containing protein n=1 Tax=Fibrella rubiginis TaxID=2817060 RepID=A0A939GFC3_9BACT|nr:hypothetical protein [Fibrella rubiginis]MBO0935691.1 hypothetical protein [Fibrella rubiginis]
MIHARLLIIILLLLTTASAWGQQRPGRTKRAPNPYRRAYQQGRFVAPDSTSPQVPFVHFPYPLARGINRATLGVTFTTSPRDITEQTQIDVPAGDLVILRGLTKNLALTGEMKFQFLQNNAMAGLRRTFPIKGRFYGSAGAGLGGWFGMLRLADFNTSGFGFMGAADVAVGFRSSRDLLVTFRLQKDLGLLNRTAVGQTVSDDGRIVSNGYGATVTLEQAFFGRRHAAIGFRALYTNFNWQFWSLYDTFDRNIFYPEVFMGFFL